MTALPTGTVTFLFTDIEGSTRLASVVGVAFPALIGEHHRLLRESIAAHDGIAVSTEGDAFFAVFQRAPDAVAAAVDAQRALGAFAWPDGAAVRVRMGIHTGDGTLGGDSYAGLDVHRAARIAAAAHGGQIVLSAATGAIAETALPAGTSLRDLGEHRLKDLDRPERIQQLVVEGLPADFPPLRSLETPTNLPPQLTGLVGRDREAAETADLLRSSRLVTLTGPGGTGKTRLSLRVARESIQDYPDGVWFVELAPIFDAALVPTTIAAALRISELPDQPVVQTVADHLAARRALLVLDNFEQIMPAAATVRQLLLGTRELRVLVTSREVLRLNGEQEYPVPPLALPDPSRASGAQELSGVDSIALFVLRARAVQPGFRLTDDNARAVAAICARLEGLPLAIELAAARLKLFSPEAIVTRLEKSLALLTGGARDLPARQQTLRGAIAWSYDLLDPDEQALFRRLGVFQGDWTATMAEQVCDPDGTLGIPIFDAVASFLDKSLVRRVDTGDSASEPRFRMLATIREFALEQLDAAGELAELRRRHATAFARLALEAGPQLEGSESIAWFDRLELEHDDLRAAIRWSIETDEAQTGLDIGGAIWRFWHQRGHMDEGRGWLRQLFELPSSHVATLARARGLVGAAGLAYWQTDYDTAQTAYEENVALRRQLGDRPGMAEALYNLGFVALVRRRMDDLDAIEHEAIQLYEELGDVLGAAKAREARVVGLLMRRDYGTARERQGENVALYREHGWVFRLADSLVLHGVLALLDGDVPASKTNVRESLDLYRESRTAAGFAGALQVGAMIALAEGRAALAAELTGAVARLKQEQNTGTTPSEVLGLDDPEAGARATLDPATFDAAFARGRAMDPEVAADYALEMLA